MRGGVHVADLYSDLVVRKNSVKSVDVESGRLMADLKALTDGKVP